MKDKEKQLSDLAYEEAVRLYGQPPDDIPEAPTEHSEADAVAEPEER